MGRAETHAEKLTFDRQRRAEHLFAVQRQLAERDSEIARLRNLVDMAQPVTRGQLEQMQSRVMAKLDELSTQLARLDRHMRERTG